MGYYEYMRDYGCLEDADVMVPKGWLVVVHWHTCRIQLIIFLNQVHDEHLYG